MLFERYALATGMDHKEVKRYWDRNAETWTRLARAGYDVYRDYVNTIRARKPAATIYR